jgi:hypothetical protein
MKVETTKKLILTKEERRVIEDLYEILNDDFSLDAYAVWDVLTDIHDSKDKDGKIITGNYYLEIID